MRVQRLRLTALAVALAIAGAGVSACGSSDDGGSSKAATTAAVGDGAPAAPTPATDAEHGFVPGAPEPGTDIPTEQVRFGLRPYADNAFLMIAMERGWFREVGIEVTPPPYGIKNSDNAVAMMLKGEVDVQAMFGPTLIPTMRSDDRLKMIAFTHLFGGWAIFANRRLGLRTVKEHMEEGLDFEAAMRATLEPLAGKQLTVAPLVDARGFVRLAFELAGVEQPKLQVLDDAKSLVLAKSDRVEFAVPTGAPITLAYQELGYTPLVTPFDILDNLPGDPEGDHEQLVQTVGLASNAGFVDEHPNAILRTVGVTWRTIDEIARDPEGTLGFYTPYLNDIAGTDLKPSDIEGLFTGLTPMISYERLGDYCTDTENTLYYKNAYGAMLADFEQEGIGKKGAKPDDLIWVCQIYQTMHWYDEQAGAALREVASGRPTAAQRELAERAKTLRSQYAFLDAYRLAVAAAG